MSHDIVSIAEGEVRAGKALARRDVGTLLALAGSAGDASTELEASNIIDFGPSDIGGVHICAGVGDPMWRYHARAAGEVGVPAGHRVRLVVDDHVDSIDLVHGLNSIGQGELWAISVHDHELARVAWRRILRIGIEGEVDACGAQVTAKMLEALVECVPTLRRLDICGSHIEDLALILADLPHLECLQAAGCGLNEAEVAMLRWRLPRLREVGMEGEWKSMGSSALLVPKAAEHPLDDLTIQGAGPGNIVRGRPSTWLLNEIDRAGSVDVSWHEHTEQLLEHALRGSVGRPKRYIGAYGVDALPDLADLAAAGGVSVGRLSVPDAHIGASDVPLLSSIHGLRKLLVGRVDAATSLASLTGLVELSVGASTLAELDAVATVAEGSPDVRLNVRLELRRSNAPADVEAAIAKLPGLHRLVIVFDNNWTREAGTHLEAALRACAMHATLRELSVDAGWASINAAGPSFAGLSQLTRLRVVAGGAHGLHEALASLTSLRELELFVAARDHGELPSRSHAAPITSLRTYAHHLGFLEPLLDPGRLERLDVAHSPGNDGADSIVDLVLVSAIVAGCTRLRSLAISPSPLEASWLVDVPGIRLLAGVDAGLHRLDLSGLMFDDRLSIAEQLPAELIARVHHLKLPECPPERLPDLRDHVIGTGRKLRTVVGLGMQDPDVRRRWVRHHGEPEAAHGHCWQVAGLSIDLWWIDGPIDRVELAALANNSTVRQVGEIGLQKIHAMGICGHCQLRWDAEEWQQECW